MTGIRRAAALVEAPTSGVPSHARALTAQISRDNTEAVRRGVGSTCAIFQGNIREVEEGSA